MFGLYRLRWLSLLLLLMLSISISGCDLLLAPEDDPQHDLMGFHFPEPPLLTSPGEGVRIGGLYYPDSEWRFLVPVQREIPWEEGISRQTLQYLIPGPHHEETLKNWGLAPSLPAHSIILGIKISEEQLARVDFNEIFLTYSPDRERLVLGSILCTLRQFPTVEQVEVVVEGEYVKEFPGGTPGRIPLGPECWINLDVESELDDYRNFTALNLYYCYLTPIGAVLYVPVTRIVTATEEVIDAALRELLKGPPRNSGLFSEIPRGTTVRQLKLEEGKLTVDFSRELLSYNGGKTGAENVVNQILLTLGALEQVETIHILVEGESRQLKDGIDLREPLHPPAVYNFF